MKRRLRGVLSRVAMGRIFLNRITIGRGHERGAILFLWGYDIVKFWLAKTFLAGQGIDPHLFLFFDMVTVPPFVMGCARLVNSLAGKVLAWPMVVGWGAIVLTNTFLPYVYAAVAGKARFTPAAWAIFWCLVLLVLGNLIRTIASQVARRKRGGCDRKTEESQNDGRPASNRQCRCGGPGIRCPGAGG